jgi:hypothetical protein
MLGMRVTVRSLHSVLFKSVWVKIGDYYAPVSFNYLQS